MLIINKIIQQMLLNYYLACCCNKNNLIDTLKKLTFKTNLLNN